MQYILKRLDVMPGHWDFLLLVAGHGEEEGAVILGLYFVDHGQVHDISLMGTEKSQRGKEAFDVPQGHPGFHDAAGGIEKGAV